MKTAFRAKIVFETEDDPHDSLTLDRIYRAIESGDTEIEVVNDFLTNDLVPVIIIKHKKR